MESQSTGTTQTCPNVQKCITNSKKYFNIGIHCCRLIIHAQRGIYVISNSIWCYNVAHTEQKKIIHHIFSNTLQDYKTTRTTRLQELQEHYLQNALKHERLGAITLRWLFCIYYLSPCLMVHISLPYANLLICFYMYSTLQIKFLYVLRLNMVSKLCLWYSGVFCNARFLHPDLYFLCIRQMHPR